MDQKAAVDATGASVANCFADDDECEYDYDDDDDSTCSMGAVLEFVKSQPTAAEDQKDATGGTTPRPWVLDNLAPKHDPNSGENRATTESNNPPSSASASSHISITSPPAGIRAPRSSGNNTARQVDHQSPLSYVAPDSMGYINPSRAFCAVNDLRSIPESTTCSICCDPLRGGIDYKPVVFLIDCGHRFHRECIVSALRHGTRCPFCRKCLDEPVGKMPSGSMTVRTMPQQDCRGYEGAGSIEIEYHMQGGTQKSYHDNPGVPYHGDSRAAYLPDNDQGRKLLKRLRYAFTHGMTFTVGTSLTNHAPNRIVWSSIHHKTSLSGGAHGFPDPGYFLNCNGDLDALGVPPAEYCCE